MQSDFDHLFSFLEMHVNAMKQEMYKEVRSQVKSAIGAIELKSA